MSSQKKLLASASVLALGIVLLETNPAAAGCPTAGTLDSACPAPVQPTGDLTITSTGSIISSGAGYAINNFASIALSNAGTLSSSGGSAVNNMSTIWTLDNSGFIGGLTAINNLGTIGAITNSGTIAGGPTAIDNLGTIGTITNSGTIAGNIWSAYDALTINGGSGSTFGTLSGGTITTSDLTFASGNLILSENIVVGSGTVSNSGATLKLASPIAITGNYAQSAGLLDLGTAGHLAVSGTATVTGGTVAIGLSDTGNYIVGSDTTLISAGAGSSYSGATVALTSITGLSTSVNTASTTNLTVAYLNDYVGGTLASLSNSGTLSFWDNDIYVTGTGKLGNLINTGTISGANMGIDNGGKIDTITNSGAITDNDYGIYNDAGGAPELGTIGTLTNIGTISGKYNAIENGGTIDTLTNTGTMSSLVAAIENTDTINSIANSGTMSGGDAAIFNAGTINAIANSGTISGGDTAIFNAGAITTIVNSGTISGDNYAIYNTGTITDIHVSGTIAGNIYSTAPLTITGSTTPGTVGTITGYNGTVGTITGNGIAFKTGALLLNDIITGTTSVYVTGTDGLLINTGTLSGTAQGVVLTSGVSLASFTNSGTVSGVSFHAISNDGSITSIDNSGSISGGVGGIASDGTIGTIINSGTITAQYGIYNLFGGAGQPGIITTITNTGTISGTKDAIYNTSTITTIVNSGLISGNVYSTHSLTINGGSGDTFGTISGGTMTVTSLTFASGNLNLSDDIAAGSGTVSNTGATLKLTSLVTVTGKYAQSAGLLDLGTSGHLAVSSTATVTGGTVSVTLPSGGNYIFGSRATLISAGAGSSYSSVAVALTGIIGLSASADTTSTTNLMAVYLNDYVGGNLASLSNTGTLSGSAYGVYVASTGTVGSLTNTGTLSGSNYAIYNLGSLGMITNSGNIGGNISSANALTVNGGSSNIFGTLSGGTITAPGLTFAAGNLILSDAIDVGSGTVSNTGATLNLTSPVAITGDYVQSSGVLDLGSAGQLTVSGSVVFDGGTIVANLNSAGNYLAGNSTTLISAGTSSSYSGATVALTGVTGLSASVDTISTTNLVVTTLNDYVGGSLASLSNTGTLSGSAYGLYIASTGSLGSLANSGTLGGNTYALYNLGSLGSIANSGTIAGNISSSGSLVFVSGTTSGTLSGGTISATGVNFVSGRTLLADNINVGTGTVNNSGATLELASLVSIAGNYVQTGGALLSDVISPTSYGSLQVSGSATVTGASITISGADVKAGQTYTIVDAGGASTYSSNTVTVGGAHYKAILTISGDDLLASIRPIFGDIGRAKGGDAAVLGDVFDNLSSVTAMQTSITTLSALSDSNLSKALLQAAPAQVSSEAVVLQRAAMMNGLIIDAIDQRSEAAAGIGWSFWGQAMGGAAHHNTVSGAEGYDTTVFGLVVGADTKVNVDLAIGGAFSWSAGWNGGVSDLSGNSNRVNSYQFTGYGSWQRGALRVNGQAGIGFNDYVQRREMRYLGGVAEAAYSGRQYTMAADGTYAVPLDGALGGAILMPAVSLRWLHLSADGFKETGAGSSDLKVGSFAADQVESGLGAKLSWAIDTSSGPLVPAFKLLWVHDFIDGITTTDAVLGGLAFSTTTARIASNGAKASAGLTFYQTGGTSVQVEYGGDFRNDYTAHTGRVEVRIAL